MHSTASCDYSGAAVSRVPCSRSAAAQRVPGVSMPTRSFRIRGNFSAPQPATRRTSGTNAPSTVLSHRLLTPGRARDGVTGELEVAADEVVRVELDNGFELWTRADALVREHGRRSLAR